MEMSISNTPALHQVEDPTWSCVDFISDLHLSAQSPETLQALESYLFKTPAQAVFILGDLLEVWIGDDSLDHEAFSVERSCLHMIQEAGLRTPIFFMPGNRDFLIGERFFAESGMRALHDPCVLKTQGKRILLSHGDALCTTDVDYQNFRQQVRSESWQIQFLSMPFDDRLSMALQLRAQSQEKQAMMQPGEHADLDHKACLGELLKHQCELMIHGHTHRPKRHELDSSHAREVLSDWDATSLPPRAQVLRLENTRLQRLDLL